MGKARRMIGISGGFELELVWMTTYFMNWVLSAGRNTKLVKWRELRKEWLRRRARMVLQSRHGLSRWERTAGECLGTASNCWGMGKLPPAAPIKHPDSHSVDHTSTTQPFVERQRTHQVYTDSMRESRGTDLLLPRVLGHCSRVPVGGNLLAQPQNRHRLRPTNELQWAIHHSATKGFPKPAHILLCFLPLSLRGKGRSLWISVDPRPQCQMLIRGSGICVAWRGVLDLDPISMYQAR